MCQNLVSLPRLFVAAIRVNRIKDILKLLSVVLVVWYYATTHLFMHTHEVNGVLIMHSHIGKDQHEHTTLEYQVFKTLSDGVMCFAQVQHFIVALAAITLLRNFGTVCPVQQTPLRHFSLRAPPALC